MTLTAASPVHTGVDPDRFRQAFRRYPAGVVVITADAGSGPVGFTATSLTSLSLTPPLASFGIATGSSSWPHIERAETAVVNFLAAEQQDVARRFATSGIDRFAAPTAWRRLDGGAPVLDGAAGWLRLAVEQLVPAGDHRIVIGRVEEVHLDESRTPLLFHNGGYLPL
ncbi:flavin reductase family protein [Streptomyces sp. SCSIO ZS0520]|uniref:flavin reductase family protein n=1 Tax=Streptomyces sp. SCSIO ZS0520 TaxID=2892996 RepID=UPI0021DB25B3|nr:flavin reductase family protein [Streptomyces sp. SCSIO ZS0520]